jgi:hypothetical protein
VLSFGFQRQFVINKYSKKFSVSNSSDMHIVVSNIDIYYWFTFRCKMYEVGFIEI